MKLMRNKRTGKHAVYDEVIVASGNWEEVIEEKKEPVDAPQEIPEFIPASQKAPKRKKPAFDDGVGVTDEVQIELVKGDADESQPDQT